MGWSILIGGNGPVQPGLSSCTLASWAGASGTTKEAEPTIYACRCTDVTPISFVTNTGFKVTG